MVLKIVILIGEMSQCHHMFIFVVSILAYRFNRNDQSVLFLCEVRYGNQVTVR